MNETAGFVAVERGVFDHPVFAPEPFTEREAWLWMIAEAAWRPCKVRVGKSVMTLERGQLAHSLRYLATRWRWSLPRVRRFLDRLSREHMTGTLATRDATRITICNYDAYQSARHTADTPPEQKPTQRRTKNNISSEPKGSSDSAKRACRLPDDWRPDELFAAREGLTAYEIGREADKFRDYWRQQPGQRGVKLDWAAAWRNWVRKASGDRKAKATLPPERRIPGFNSF